MRFKYNLHFPCNTWWSIEMKRDIQGKFALKNDDYRRVRSLGMSRADYLEEMVRKNLLPCITRDELTSSPCNTWNIPQTHPSITRYQEEIEKLKIQINNLQKENSVLVSYAQRRSLRTKTALTFVREVVDFEAIRNRILFELKLGRQASGYKAAQKALNRLIAELKRMAETL